MDLQALIDGTISSELEHSLETHVSTCEICGQTLEDLCKDERDEHWQKLVDGSESLIRDTRQHEQRSSLRQKSPDLLKTAPQFDGFEILSVAGQGGMGMVYRARQHSLNRDVAIKMLHSTAPDDLDRVERFKNEADSIARIQHPNIISIYEINQHEDVPFIVLEYIHGPDLSHVIKTSAPFDNYSAAQLVQKLALAMDAAHQQNLIHRDLKPANILLRVSNDHAPGVFELKDCEPKIADFGLAKSFEFDNKTKTSILVGTPSYMAPEQITCPEDWAKPTVDVYALGVILYELLTGQVPFQGKSTFEQFKMIETRDPPATRSLNRNVSKDLDAICLRCLEKSPAARYASTKLLADDLERFLRREPVIARNVSAITKIRKWATRNKLQVALGFVGLVALTFLGALLANIAKQRRAATEDFQKRIQTSRELFVQAKSAELLDLSEWDPVLKEIEMALQLQNQFPNLIDQAEAKALYENLEFHRATRQLFFDVDAAILNHEIDSQKPFLISHCSDTLKRSFGLFKWLEPKLAVEQAADRMKSLDEKTLEAFLTTVYRGLLYIDNWQERDWYMKLAKTLDKNDWRTVSLNAVLNQDTKQILGSMDQSDLTQQVSSGSLSDFGNFFYQVSDVDPQLVIEFLKQCHLQNPSSFWLNFRLANTIRKFEFTTNAVSYMRAAIAQRESLAIRMQLGSMFVEMEDYNAAGREYASLLEQHPERQLTVLPEIARVFRHQKKYDDSIRNLQKVLNQKGVANRARADLLETYLEAGRQDEAVEIARRWIVGQITDDGEGFYLKSVAFRAIGNLREAEQQMKLAQEADPGNLWYTYELSDLYRRQKKYDLAKLQLDVLLGLIPQELTVTKRMMDVLVDAGELEAAIELAKTKVEMFKREPEYYAYLGQIYEKAGEDALAENNYDTSATRLGQLAILYKNQRNFDLAVATCNKAISINPSTAQANFLLVQVLCMLDRMDEALDASKRYKSNAPDSVYSHASVLNTLVLMKRFDDAIEAFQQGQKFDSIPPKIFSAGQLERLKKMAAKAKKNESD